MKDLFPPERRDLSAYGDGNRRKGYLEDVHYTEKEVYPYEDERGEVLYEVVRCEPKNFFQRRKCATSKIGYTFGLGDIRRVLFRLPALVDPARQHQPIIVCEGEGKVLLLESMGLMATCNVGGCGMGWRAEYSQTLTGRRVVVLPDNDLPGHRHAESIVGSLLHHGVGSVRFCVLPGLPDKGDVKDFMAAGHGREDLLEVIRKCPEWRPT